MKLDGYRKLCDKKVNKEFKIFILYSGLVTSSTNSDMRSLTFLRQSESSDSEPGQSRLSHHPRDHCTLPAVFVRTPGIRLSHDSVESIVLLVNSQSHGFIRELMCHFGVSIFTRDGVAAP